ncbi:MAG: phosphatidate cytidylyltransferase, partial [Bacteroidota bacterium]
MNSNLINRILTALVAGSASIAAIVLTPYGIWFFCFLVSMLGLWEFLSVCGIQEKKYRFLLMGWGLGIWLMALSEIISPGKGGALFIPWSLGLLPMLLLVLLFNPQETSPVPQIGIMVLGVVYPFLPLFLLFQIAVLNGVAQYDFWLPLGILLMTWVLDSGAYFVGRWLGKRPLFPRISPKKTWEGSIGGAVFCLILAGVFQYFLSPVLYNWLIIGGIIAIFSQMGDLVESMFKRSMNIKDSGSILPGHGGMLDRFDGVYLSAPLIFLYFS